MICMDLPYFITYKAYFLRINFVKKSRLEHIIGDLLILVYFIDFELRTYVCLNNNMLYSHQDF